MLATYDGKDFFLKEDCSQLFWEWNKHIKLNEYLWGGLICLGIQPPNEDR